MSTLTQNAHIRYRDIFALAFPMVISQASETVMTFVDRLFLSRVSMEAMSAAMAGGLSSFVFQSFFIGLIGYTNALVAQYYGAGRLERGVRTVTQGLFLSIAAFPVALALIPLGNYTFVLAGHNPVQIELEQVYFTTLMFGAFFAFVRSCLSAFFVGIGRTTMVLVANVAGMLVNIPLNYLLIFGKFGFPEMGILGAAIGTLGGALLTILILIWAYLRAPEYRQHLHSRSWKPDPIIFRSLLRFGIPAGVEMFLNVMAFNIGLQLFHSYGSGVAAAVTITFNYDSIVFIPMLGMGFAATSLVGRSMGAGNPEGAAHTAVRIWKLSLVYGGIIMLVFITSAPALVALFAANMADLGKEYLDMAASMLRLASLYIFADMTQLMFSSALRGAGDTKWVMRTSVILHWFYAIFAIMAVKVIGAGPMVMWGAFIGFVILLGVAMSSRFIKGNWKTMTIIEESPEDLSGQDVKTASVSW